MNYAVTRCVLRAYHSCSVPGFLRERRSSCEQDLFFASENMKNTTQNKDPALHPSLPLRQVRVMTRQRSCPRRSLHPFRHCLSRRYHPYARKHSSLSLLVARPSCGSLNTSRRFALGASKKPIWSVKTRRAPSRHCRETRVYTWSCDYGHTWHEFIPSQRVCPRCDVQVVVLANNSPKMFDVPL